MANCTNCGTKITEGIKFCPSCGTAVSSGKKTTRAKSAAADQTKEIQVSPADAEQNRGMAVVCYLVFFIPLVISEHKKSEYVKFHANQGTVLFLFGVAGWIVLSLLFGIIAGISIRTFSFGLFGFMAFLWTLFGILYLVLTILGIVNSLKCKTSRLPIIGKFQLIK